MITSITAVAPAKVILLGEHAVNRGQAALAVSVGLYARCHIRAATDDRYTLTGAERERVATRQEILSLGALVDGWRATQDYSAIQELAAHDFFAPALYLLAALGNALPPALQISFESEIPPSSGLGSGGALFTALAAALQCYVGGEGAQQVAAWARRGDIVAHGGVASGLDTQTALYGGAIRYTAINEGEPLPYAPGLALVVGNSGVFAATSAVNGRVRRWLAEQPARMHYFELIGLLSQQAEVALRAGEWRELGRLLTLNQLVLQQIGVSCPELEALNEAALAAGAWGAKLSGSGGGGVMVALCPTDATQRVAAAITQAGGQAIVVPVGVAGVRVMRDA